MWILPKLIYKFNCNSNQIPNRLSLDRTWQLDSNIYMEEQRTKIASMLFVVIIKFSQYTLEEEEGKELVIQILKFIKP